MTRAEAVAEVCTALGAVRVTTGPVYHFRDPERADVAKRVLDALLPAGSTGEVCGAGMLMVSAPEPCSVCHHEASQHAKGPNADECQACPCSYMRASA